MGPNPHLAYLTRPAHLAVLAGLVCCAAAAPPALGQELSQEPAAHRGVAASQPAPAPAAQQAAAAPAPLLPLPPGCQLLWQITPRLDTTPRSLTVQMRFDSGSRGRTSLRLPAGWTHVQEPQVADGSAARLLAVPGDSQLRQVRHEPGAPVQLAWQLNAGRSADGAGPMLAPRWFAFSGDSVLPWPDELAAEPALQACVALQAPDGQGQLVSSLGPNGSGAAQWSVRTGMAELQHALFAGGALQVVQRRVDGQPLTVALPEEAGFSFGPDALADSTAASLGHLRALWSPAEAAPLLLLLVPGDRAAGGVALHQAVVLQAPTALAVPSLAFDELLGSQWLRTWLPARLGPIAHLGRGDSALRAWFTDGIADFLLHRWLLREGRWTLDSYAEAMNRKLARYQALPEADADNLRVASGLAGPDALALLPAARGEWLALGWHQALRHAGQPGLDSLLRSLALPLADAHREGPISAPLATHRLLAGLRRHLGDEPLREITQHIDQGGRFNFNGDSLGPCFEAVPDSPTLAWRPRAQALLQSGCQAWLNDGPARPGEGAIAGALPAAAAAAAAVGRQVCSTVRPKKGAKGAQAKPRTVCKTVGPSAGKAAAARPQNQKAQATQKNQKRKKNQSGKAQPAARR